MWGGGLENKIKCYLKLNGPNTNQVNSQMHRYKVDTRVGYQVNWYSAKEITKNACKPSHKDSTNTISLIFNLPFEQNGRLSLIAISLAF